MIENACAVIVADEGSLLEVGGASSLAHLVNVARAARRIRELVVMTAHDGVRAAAQNLGVPTIEDQILTRVPVDWSRDRAPQGRNPSAPPSAAPPSIPKRQIPLGLRASAPGGVVVAAPTTLLESEKYDALLLLNGAKPLVDTALVNATLDALSGAGTVVLVAEASRSWRRSTAAPGHVRIEEQHFADLDAVYGVRLMADGCAEVVVTGPEAGWDVREAVQYTAIAATFAERRRVQQLERLPEVVGGLVMDFDGVFTDNAVWLDEAGKEAVRCHRGDGLGLGMLRQAGLPMAVISKERNPVVMARCAKLALECFQGVDDKLTVLKAWAATKGIDREQLLYVGNDVNDLECLAWAGCGVVVADAHPDVLHVSDLILHHNGGNGALRELADMVCERVRGYFPLVAR
jgi:YrbI family 3-deoxy-D-manno-octulosonate 8-phosphate phosphatase